MGVIFHSVAGDAQLAAHDGVHVGEVHAHAEVGVPHGVALGGTGSGGLGPAIFTVARYVFVIGDVVLHPGEEGAGLDVLVGRVVRADLVGELAPLAGVVGISAGVGLEGIVDGLRVGRLGEVVAALLGDPGLEEVVGGEGFLLTGEPRLERRLRVLRRWQN